MNKLFIFLILFVATTTLSRAQLGVGTITPKAYFNIIPGKTVLFGADTSGNMSGGALSTDSKLIWYGTKGAFRAGGLTTDPSASTGQYFWDLANVGAYSFASGFNNKASGSNSFAMGSNNLAEGTNSVAMGTGSVASGQVAIALGQESSALGLHSAALGYALTASGIQSVVIGSDSRVLADFAFSLGTSNDATNEHAVSIGNANVSNAPHSKTFGYDLGATGAYSTAMGNSVETNSYQGSFAIGDYDPAETLYQTTAENQMMMRFRGGYAFYSNAPTAQNTAVGVSLPAGANAWTTISDSTRKENFRAADGACFLRKIANMRLGSWNYKGQDVKQYRHYGPMAQDFFAAFGNDGLGTIGEDKAINQADFDGVNLIAIQALIKEVESLKAENKGLRAENAAIKEESNDLNARLDKIESLLGTQQGNQTISLKP